jgi:5'(3')-deoxyribonucleotidase
MQSIDLTDRKLKIYIDMDGVLADLFGHAQGIHNVETYKSLTKDQWEKFFSDSDAEELFSNLPPFPTTNKLLQMVVEMFGGYSILSSPLSFDGPGSIRGKKIWIAKNITVPSEQDIFDHEKYRYAIQENGTPNILIDDYKVNIKLWVDHGGIGIKFQSDEDSLVDLKNKLKQAVIKTL